MAGRLFWAAAGAAAMYFADPQQGRARRSRAQERLGSAQRAYARRRGGGTGDAPSAGASLIDLTQVEAVSEQVRGGAAAPPSPATSA
jgi:hypothetical protein